MATIPTADEVRRELARRDFHYFLKWARPQGFNWDYPHLRAQQAVIQSVIDGTTGQRKWFMAKTPPQHGKTQQNTIGLAAWLLHRDPSTRIGIGSYAQFSANRMNLQLRHVVTELGLPIRADRNAVEEWVTTEGGGVRAVGRGGSLTGWPVDVMILDDMVKDRMEAESSTIRQATRDWLTDVVLTRNPKQVFCTGTPWHYDDAIAFLLAQFPEMFTEITLPALAVDGDILGRDTGAPLCPELWSRERLLMQMQANPYSFEAIFQCNPTPREGSLFKVSQFNFCDIYELPIGLNSVIRWDFGYSSSGDYSVGVLMAGPDTQGRYYVVDMVRGQFSASALDNEVLAFSAKHGKHIRVIVPQDGGSGKHVVASMIRLLAGYPVEPVVESASSGSKEVRAMPFAAQVNAGNIVLVRAAWNTEFIEEHRQFPAGKYDDQVDAASGAFNYLAVPSVIIQSW